MPSLNAVIIPAKVLKGGRHRIRISLAHNGETKYIVTDITIDSSKEFKNGRIVKRGDAAYLNTKLRRIIQKYQDVIDQMEYVNGLTCGELLSQIKNFGNNRHRTLKSIYDEFMETSDLKPNTAACYVQRWKRITSYLKEDIIMDNINYATVVGLDKYLRNKGLAPGTICHTMQAFATFINYAKRCGYVRYTIEPMTGYRMPKPDVGQSWVTPDDIKNIRDYKCKKRGMRLAHDLFMLSYYLGGINMVDLVKINFNEQVDKIKYIRTKTENRQKVNPFVEFDIPEEAKEIISRLKGDDGILALTPFQRSSLCNKLFSYNFPVIAEAIGVKHLIYYSARKSFAQHAFNLGVRESVINYILGHKLDQGGTSLYHYISVTPQQATEAIRKVLDNLK